MHKQTESLTESVKAGNLALLSLTERLSLQETMRQMEAKEWARRYRDKQAILGKVKAQTWWLDLLEDMTKKRGKPAVDDLRNRMNGLKYEIRREG